MPTTWNQSGSARAFSWMRIPRWRITAWLARFVALGRGNDAREAHRSESEFDEGPGRLGGVAATAEVGVHVVEEADLGAVKRRRP
jgi:hypothetical protein